MRELVFVHGRSQQFKDATALKAEWIESFREGLHRAGLDLPIPESDIRFPYYGQTLYDLVEGVPDDEVADVVVRGASADPEHEKFARGMLSEICGRFDITDDRLRDLVSVDTVDAERGALNWKPVQALLRIIDKHVPGASSASVAIFTDDFYAYLSRPGFQGVVDGGVRDAFDRDTETVVVSHSLGTVVAYNLLRCEGAALGLNVPLHVTLGSPLAVKVVKEKLRPIGYPECVGSWFNALDPHDVVALYPLTADTFPVTPTIENKIDVDNQTPNQHGIAGYLNDAEVARRIHQALVAP